MLPSEIIVGIDDGHGIYDKTGTKENPGKRTPLFPDGSYILENVFNRGVAGKFETACRRQGFIPLQLAPEDTNTPLDTRVYRANAWGCNIVVSWHFNAYRGNWDEVKGGISVHYQKGYNNAKKLAECVLKYLVQGTKQNNRGIVADDLQICRETKGTAILIESGFMDVMAEAKLMDQEWHWEEQAEQACQGLCEYLGMQYIPTVKEVKKKVKNLVVYGNKEYKPAAETLAYKLKCPIMDADIPFDYSTIENVYCIGTPGKLPFTSYAKQIISGANSDEVIRKVLDFKWA